MATLSERLALIIDFDGAQAVKGLEGIAKKSSDAESKWTKAGDSLTKFGAAGLAASGVAAVGLSKLALGASDLNEVTSKTKVIFGDASDEVIAFAKNAGKSLGQSETAALGAATQVAQLGKAAGLTGQDLGKFSTDLVTLAGDLASFNNTSPEDAVMALSAALRGESEPIRAYGVLLDDATLKNRALSMGLIETTKGTLPPAIKVQAAYAEILAQTTDAQGDFARTSDGAANQQRILAAELKNLADGIGTGILPAFTGIVSVGADVVGKLNDMGPAAKQALGSLAAGGVGVVAALSGVSLVAGQVAKLRDRFTEVGEAGRELTTAGKFAVGASVGLGVFAAAAGLIQAKAADAREAVSDLEATMSRTGDTAAEAAKRMLLEWVYSNEKARKAMDEAGLSTEDLLRALSGTGAEFTHFRDKITEANFANGKLKVASFDLTREIERQRGAVRDKTKADEAAAEAQRTLEVGSREAISAAVALSGVTDVVAESTKDAAEAAKDLADEEEALKEATEKQEGAAKRLADAQRDRADATRDAYRAAEESVNPILRERNANRELAAAADDVKKKTDEAAKAKFKDKEKNGEVAAGQDGLIEKMAEVAAAYATAQGASDGTREHAKLYVDKLKELRDQYGVQLGPAIAIYDELIRRVETTLRLQDELNRTAAGYNVGGGGDRGQPGRPVAFSFGGAASSVTVPAMGQTINLTVKVDAPIVTQQGAQWVADAVGVMIRTNGTGWLASLGVQTR